MTGTGVALCAVRCGRGGGRAADFAGWGSGGETGAATGVTGRSKTPAKPRWASTRASLLSRFDSTRSMEFEFGPAVMDDLPLRPAFLFTWNRLNDVDKPKAIVLPRPAAAS